MKFINTIFNSATKNLAKWVVVVLAFSFQLQAQQNQAADNPWKMMQYFEGHWSGHETGKAGIGKGTREYKWVIGKTFLLSENQSAFDPQEKNPTGELHEDWTIFSFDKSQHLLIARQFNSEGFVNTFAMDTVASDSSKLVFVSTHSENAPTGLKARLTFHILDENHFEERFDLAFPGKEFSEWLNNSWTRKTEHH